MARVASTGTLEERWGMAGAENLPEDIQLIFARDLDWRVRSSFLSDPFRARAAVRAMEDDERNGRWPDSDPMIAAMLGEQVTAQVSTKLSIPVHDLWKESIVQVCDDLGLSDSQRSSLLAIWLSERRSGRRQLALGEQLRRADMPIESQPS